MGFGSLNRHGITLTPPHAEIYHHGRSSSSRKAIFSNFAFVQNNVQTKNIRVGDRLFPCLLIDPKLVY